MQQKLRIRNLDLVASNDKSKHALLRNNQPLTYRSRIRNQHSSPLRNTPAINKKKNWRTNPLSRSSFLQSRMSMQTVHGIYGVENEETSIPQQSKYSNYRKNSNFKSIDPYKRNDIYFDKNFNVSSSRLLQSPQGDDVHHKDVNIFDTLDNVSPQKKVRVGVGMLNLRQKSKNLVFYDTSPTRRSKKLGKSVLNSSNYSNNRSKFGSRSLIRNSTNNDHELIKTSQGRSRNDFNKFFRGQDRDLTKSSIAKGQNKVSFLARSQLSISNIESKPGQNYQRVSHHTLQLTLTKFRKIMLSTSEQVTCLK